MRKLHYLSTMVNMIKKFDADLVAPDQDYMNVILRGKIGELDASWNAEPVVDLPKNTKLVHFNLFNKPWYYKDVPCEKLFWDAARGTGFTGDLRRQQAGFNAEKQKAEQEKVAALIEKAARLAKAKKPLLSLDFSSDKKKSDKIN